MKRFVLAAIQELSRHETRAQAESELDLYEATTEITYVVLRLPDEKTNAEDEQVARPRDARKTNARTSKSKRKRR
jgi:hypothetical protein